MEKDKAISEWTLDDVQEWLRENELTQYCDKFSGEL